MLSDKPRLIHLPFTTKMKLLLIKEDRAIYPKEGLQRVLPFEADANGGWICAAKATNDKWGYLNGDGEWVIPPILDDAKTFSDGIARFCENNLWGFINLRGEKITPAIYPNATAFRQGYARVLENGWGFINNQGEKIIPTEFHNATDFCGGIASVEVQSMQWRIINTQGEFTCKKTFSVIDRFSKNGLAGASLSSAKEIRNKQIKIGFINAQGDWVIEPKFRDIKAFGDMHLTSASLDEKTYGLINEEGSWVVEPCYDRLYPFNEYGLAFFEDRGYNTKHGFVDAQGTVVMQGGYDLKSPMPCGIARENCRYINAKGEKLPTAGIQYGIDFDGNLQAAIVNMKSESPMGNWGLLQASGDVYKIGDNILEPLVTNIGWVDLQFSSDAVPFLTNDNKISWLNGKAEEVYSAHICDTTIELKNAQGKAIWSSDDISDIKIPDVFFNISENKFLFNIPNIYGIKDFAEKLLKNSEARLHSFVEGEELKLDRINQECNRSFDYNLQELFDCEEEDLENEELSYDILQSYLICEHQKVLHVYQNEFHAGTYNFFWDAQIEQAKELKSALVEVLTQTYGEPDPDPEFFSYWGNEDGMLDMQAWCIDLKTLLLEEFILPDTNKQWLILYTYQDSGDGDQWLTSWLMTAPSADAAYIAKALRNKKPLTQAKSASKSSHKTIAPSVEIPDVPVDYNGWLEIAVQHKMNIGEIPEKWIDDKMVDSAIAADTKALAYTPVKWQTAERLAKLITQDLKVALHIPPQCMTEEGLDLARSLYEHEREWNSHDSRCCELPAEWNQDSFYQLWGCLLNAEMAHKGIIGGAALNKLPVWLKTDEIEMLAVRIDIHNLRYMKKEKITPELIASLSSVGHGEILDCIPFQLLTPELCLDSINNQGLSLEDVPTLSRTQEVCVAAMRNNLDNFIYVPDKYRIEVIDQLIALSSGEVVDSEETPVNCLYVQRAWAKLWAGDYSGAIADVQLSINERPDEAHAHYILASAYHKLGKIKDACREAKIVLSQEPHYTPAWSHEKTTWLHQLSQENNSSPDHAEQLRKYPSTLKEIPRDELTEELIDIALSANSEAIKFVPKRFMNSQRYLIALQQHHKTLWQIPKKFLTEAICIQYVSSNGWRLTSIPKEFKTFSVCLAAVRESSYVIKYTPETIKADVAAASNISA